MSILKVFRNFQFSILLVLAFLSLIVYAFINTGYDLEKAHLTESLKSYVHNTLELSPIELEISQGKLKQYHLHMDITLDKIKDLRELDFIKQQFLNFKEPNQAFEALTQAIQAFKVQSTSYFNYPDQEALQKLRNLEISFIYASLRYNEQLLKNITHKNQLSLYMTITTSIAILLIFLWYARRLAFIYKDIKTLLSIEQEEREKAFKTQEFTAISHRLNKRPAANAGKNMKDPLTDLLNEKGVLSEFAHRGNFSAKDYICVTIFDVDNYKENETRYGKDFADAMIKKIALIIGLEKKPSDIIGRIGVDKFIFITAHEQKEAAYKAMDKIRAVIEQTEFKPNRSDKVSITISGGFALKDSHTKIETAIGSASSMVRRAKLQGKNNIAKFQNFDEERNKRM